MQQYTIPQFIDVEDKIIGAITVRQFIIMLVGGFFIFLSFRFLRFDYFIGAAIVILFVVAILGFFKVNGRPFHYFMLNFIQTNMRPRVRVWLKDLRIEELRLLLHAKPQVHVSVEIPLKHSLRGSSLSELSLIVDTGGTYQGEDNEEWDKPMDQDLK